jgi:hypothetical protein
MFCVGQINTAGLIVKLKRERSGMLCYHILNGTERNLVGILPLWACLTLWARLLGFGLFGHDASVAWDRARRKMP